MEAIKKFVLDDGHTPQEELDRIELLSGGWSCSRPTLVAPWVVTGGEHLPTPTDGQLRLGAGDQLGGDPLIGANASICLSMCRSCGDSRSRTGRCRWSVVFNIGLLTVLA